MIEGLCGDDLPRTTTTRATPVGIVPHGVIMESVHRATLVVALLLKIGNEPVNKTWLRCFFSPRSVSEIVDQT